MSKKFKFSIAVDGSSASGKSTGSKYISTGWWLYPKEGKQD